ncbi:MAG: hypothetical protein HY302_12155 [Opitutae bacterium]|nr:hypothetical protein [Opitutae bacterium]
MKRIRVYRHRDCRRCARKAALLRFFDWLGRTESSTDEPKSGPLRRGQVVVEDIRTGEPAFGARAFDRICRHVPLYQPLRLLLLVPAFYRAIERDMNGTGHAGADGRATQPPAAAD